MPRSLSEWARNQAEAQQRGDVPLIFCRIVKDTRESPVEAVHIVSEGTQAGVSLKNGKPVNYFWRNLLWAGLPFRLTPLSDTDRTAAGHIVVPNTDRRIGQFALSLSRKARIWAGMCWLSDFTDALNADNAREPVAGDPLPDYEFRELMYLRNVSVDSLAVEGDYGPTDYQQEPWPRIRTTQDRYPGLFV